jgi:general transcription factor 3C polypeptide 5 (transcription factor C subunit 1)
MEADKEAIDRASSIPSEAKAEMERLLAERPIISRLAVYCMASPSLRPHLKALLPSLAYYFVNGPWRHTWVKYGLDPRQSPEYRKQQILECRNIYTPSRSTVNKQQASRGRRGGMQQVKRRASGHAIPENGHIFDGIALNGNFFMYQLCDLIYDETQSIVDDQRLVSTTLSEKEGWYQEGTLAKLRDVVKRRWQVLRDKVKAPSYVDFEREQAELEDVLMSGVASTANPSSSQPSPFSAADFAGILGDDIASPFASGDSDADEFFIFDESM